MENYADKLTRNMNMPVIPGASIRTALDIIIIITVFLSNNTNSRVS